MTGLPQQPAPDRFPFARKPSANTGAAHQDANEVTLSGRATDPDLVQRLTDSILADPRICHLRGTRLPDRNAIAQLVDDLRELVFPGFFVRRNFSPANLSMQVQELLASVILGAEEQIRSVLRYVRDIGPEQADCPESVECDRRARRIAREFADEIPEIRRMLSLDVLAAFDGDPAAEHSDEAIFCYPGIDAIFSHRLAHALYLRGVPLLPRIIQEMAHSRTGIDIHPGARIGESFFIDHGGGTVIGETTIIGNHVRIYQGVTLGAKSFQRDEQGRLLRSNQQRHPTIGNRVTIYAGAVILGGDTTIGDDCVISGATFVTSSVPPGHVVLQPKAELVMRTNKDAQKIIEGGG
ncbi:MAG: serine O-acetyltransferase [Phycisphaerales bacterium]